MLLSNCAACYLLIKTDQLHEYELDIAADSELRTLYVVGACYIVINI